MLGDLGTNMRLDKLLNTDKLKELLRDGYILETRHPSLPLRILNYTKRCTFQSEWPWEACVCRGLIVDDRDAVVSRPLMKFFNLGQMATVPINGGILQAPVDADFLANCVKTYHSELEITRKLDGWCLLGKTKLNLWDGGTITIREVVKNRLKVTLVGKNQNGNIVPSVIENWFDNGKKDNWILVTIDCLPSRKSGCRTGNHLPITDEQEVEINGVFQPVKNVKVGDFMTTYLDTPSSNVLKVMKASLLGDGSVLPHGNSYNFSETHKREHLDYVLAISLWLGECGLKIYDAVSGFGSHMARIDSKAYLSLKTLREEWYPYGVKVVPTDLSWIDDFVVAQWYMGDGSLSHSELQQDRALLATNGFLKEDVDRLASKLTEIYGVSCTVYDSKGWSIRINAGKNNEISAFWLAISPHVIPSMRYKLPLKYRDVEHVPYPYGREQRIPVNAQVLNVQKLDDPNSSYFSSGRKGFDIQTTTGNYFAKGVLVHNCGISYFYDGYWGVASRGSFTSPGARWATDRLQKLVKNGAIGTIAPDHTVFFEIVSKITKVVVPYKWEDLVLLALIDNETGEEAEYPELRGLWTSLNLEQGKQTVRLVDKFDKTILDCVGDKDTTEEGYVVAVKRKGQVPVRAKIKLEEYCRLHRIVTGVTPQKVWKELAYPMSPWLDHSSKMDHTAKTVRHDITVPRDFAEWVRKWQDKMTKEFHAKLVETLHVLGQFCEARHLVRDNDPAELPEYLVWDRMRSASPEYAVAAAYKLHHGHVVEAYQTLWKSVRPVGREEVFYEEGKGE